MDIKTDDKIRLLDMADAIREIQGYMGEVDYQEFSISDDIRESVSAQMVYIGEAAEILSDEFKEQYGDIDWDVLVNLKYARYDEEYEQEHRQMMYLASQDLPVIMNEILDVASMVEDEDDLDQVSLNEEDKQDIASLQEDRKISNSHPKAEEVFTDEDSELEGELQVEEEADDSYIDQRYEDEDIIENSSLKHYPEEEEK